jgi:phospholipase C
LRPSGLNLARRRRVRGRPSKAALVSVSGCIVFSALAAGPTGHGPQAAAAPVIRAGATVVSATGIHKIKHVVMIMQENRSFDSYFGTFPGADGIPMRNGVPTVCSWSVTTHRCIRPFRDDAERNVGGPHGMSDSIADIDGGKMDGFVASAERAHHGAASDVMGYHTARSIPNYWRYAQHFVLNDHMFASQPSWSLPEHLYTLSEWSAICSRRRDPLTCASSLRPSSPPTSRRHSNVVSECSRLALTTTCHRLLRRLHVGRKRYLHALISTRCKLGDSYRAYNDSYSSSTFRHCTAALRHAGLRSAVERALLAAAEALRPPDYAWTDLTYLLYQHHVSWGYYVMTGTEPDCRDDGAVTCPPRRQDWRTPGIWNPLPYFDTVRIDGQLADIHSLTAFYRAARRGSLPAVSWISPSGQVSEHPEWPVSNGQAYVTGLINTIMRGPDWRSTAIFLSWDEWGGFYDHVPPPNPHYGLRVPGLVISPYAKRGYVDHQVLSHDAYIKFIEDDFLGGARLDPKTDGRPDPRTRVPENDPSLGDLVHDFDFNQPPRRTFILPGQTIY